ncbi:MAG TPA: pilus assembly protein PilP [Oligoflexus sp.]|uniref:pilus assembly protein PilP n=1 Tax=Oligoflexus sp. TaxID=1971216 RepID=UPI002D7F9ABB|nr:pilus assembly protein PilP [Oligoflexus sp.]HET9239961.1 pilus assembly protein PilP [Oligoflexus sp.]
MMRWLRPVLLLLLLPSASGFAADPVEARKLAQGAAPANGKAGKKKKQAERLDLNQIDLEQVEEEWDSTPTKSTVDMGNSVKIREIVEPSGEYTYASFGRPDPFMAPAALMDPGANAGATPAFTPEGSEIKIVSPLQRYPLSDLNVKGVWQLSSGETRAVILTPKGEGVVVKEGDPISSGKVLSIKREQLTVRLYRLRADGVREYEDVGMKIGGAPDANQGVIKLDPGKDPVFVNPEANSKPAPLSKALENPVMPASPVAIPAGAGAGMVVPGIVVPAGAAAAIGGAVPAQPAPPVEKGLDPVVPRAPK